MRLEFPDGFTKIDRDLIQAALDRVCSPQMFITGAASVFPPGIPEAFAVQHILNVAQVVVSRLPQPFPEARRRDLEHLLAQIIACVARRRVTPASSLVVFERRGA